MLHEAAEYTKHGWAIIPLYPGSKKPACGRWKHFQQQPPSSSDLKTWFGNGHAYGVAVLLGEVSGNLICRDFDEMDAYEEWASKNPDLAASLPTVKTGRPGRHVYCRGDIGQIRQASPTGRSIMMFDDGELRGAGYCALPHSIHPSGHVYEWLIPFADEIPFVDLYEAGFLAPRSDSSSFSNSIACNREHRDTREEQSGQREQRQQRTCPLKSEVTMDSLLHQQVAMAIQRTLLTGHRQRHKMLFEFARELKAIPGLADAELTELKPVVMQWHERAMRFTDSPFEESWFDFTEGWGKVKYPKGKGPVDMLFEKVLQSNLPEEANIYEQEKLRQLVGLCRELQRATGPDQPFFLACRTAQRLLGVNYVRVSRWLRGLQRDGILELAEASDAARRKANRYRYLKDLGNA